MIINLDIENKTRTRRETLGKNDVKNPFKTSLLSNLWFFIVHIDIRFLICRGTGLYRGPGERR